MAPTCTSHPAVVGADGGSPRSSYDRLTLHLRPVLFVNIAPGSARRAPSLSSCVGAGSYLPSRLGRPPVRLPDGESAGEFNGSQLLRFRSSSRLSMTTTGQLSVQAWIRPETLRFRHVEGSGYVEWLGKGAPGSFEYALRMYSLGNAEHRDNRISGYAFNSAGGKGSGAYFEDPIATARWLMVAVEYDTRASARFPAGWVAIFKNGRLRQRVGLDQFAVTPHPSSAPFTIGSLDGRSFFEGAIAKVAVFDQLLSARTLTKQYQTMMGPALRRK